MNMNVQVKLKAEVAYSREKPPPSISAAERRLDEISLTVEKITTDLTYKDAASFPTDKEYDDWNGRARTALSYFKTEKMFVEGWVKDKRGEFERQREAVAREAERRAREEERARRPEREQLQSPTDVFGNLMLMARDAYHGLPMRPEHKAFFESTFAV